MVILFERLRNWREVQALKAAHFDDIVLKTPLLSLQRYYVVDVLEQARDGVRRGADCVWYIPENVRERKAVPLDCQSKAHVGRVESRAFARAVTFTLLVNFWTAEHRPMRSPANCVLASRSKFRTCIHPHRLTRLSMTEPQTRWLVASTRDFKRSSHLHYPHIH
jgi:hypothetical protein